MITELRIGNFKAFGETQRVPIKPLTLIFGANSSGKSSIIHSLLLANHGMETGEYDVHQPKLAGDMVDLGGFRNYVHKQDPTNTVKLRLETDIDRESLREQLNGEADEKAPFAKGARFGLSLTLAARDATWEEILDRLPVKERGKTLSQCHRRPTLAGIEVLFDGQPVLTFSRILSGEFSARTSVGSRTFLRPIFKSTMEFSRVRLAGRRIVDDGLSSQQQAVRDQKLKEDVEEIRRQFTSGEAPTEADLANFDDLFGKVIAEDWFLFEHLVLRDVGERTLRDWPSGRGQIAEGIYDSLLGFFREIKSWDDDNPLWWAEAQAVRHNLSNVMTFCTTRIAESLRSFSYLGPLRCVPSRHLTMQGIQDPKLFASGGLAWELACLNPDIVRAVNKWLGPERLGTPYRLEHRRLLDAGRVETALEEGGEALEQLKGPADLTELVFADIRAETVLSHRDIGSGVGQVVPVLVNACGLREHMIAIEQPELHLHPAHQAELGDVFIESAMGQRKNTFLLETHSEHLILRILRRIRETTAGTPTGLPAIRPEDVAVLYVKPTDKGSVVTELPVTPDGDFSEPWPDGFFPERAKELF